MVDLLMLPCSSLSSLAVPDSNLSGASSGHFCSEDKPGGAFQDLHNSTCDLIVLTSRVSELELCLPFPISFDNPISTFSLIKVTIEINPQSEGGDCNY